MLNKHHYICFLNGSQFLLQTRKKNFYLLPITKRIQSPHIPSSQISPSHKTDTNSIVITEDQLHLSTCCIIREVAYFPTPDVEHHVCHAVPSCFAQLRHAWQSSAMHGVVNPYDVNNIDPKLFGLPQLPRCHIHKMSGLLQNVLQKWKLHSGVERWVFFFFFRSICGWSLTVQWQCIVTLQNCLPVFVVGLYT